MMQFSNWMPAGLALIVNLVVSFSVGFLFAFLWEITTIKIGHLAYQRGYHFHHSLFALLVLLLIPFVWNDVRKILLIISFSIGILVQHSIKDGFKFIERIHVTS